MKKFVTIALVLLMTVGATVALKPASSSAIGIVCSDGLFCAWAGNNKSGALWQYAYSVYGPTYACRTTDQGLASWNSVQNRFGSGLAVNVYDHLGCAGSGITIQNQQYIGNLGSIGWSNQNSSMMIIP